MFFYCCSSPKSIAVQRSFQELMYVHIVYMLEICWIYTMWLWYDVCIHVYIIWVELNCCFFSFTFHHSQSGLFIIVCAVCHMREVILPLILFLSFFLSVSLSSSTRLSYFSNLFRSFSHIYCPLFTRYCNKAMEMYRMEVCTHTQTHRRTAMYASECANILCGKGL